jgi:hypothetical protein
MRLVRLGRLAPVGMVLARRLPALVLRQGALGGAGEQQDRQAEDVSLHSNAPGRARRSRDCPFTDVDSEACLNRA